MRNATLTVRQDRIQADLAELATFTDRRAEGWTRVALSDLDRDGREWALRKMREVGLDARIDPVGNVLGVLTGSAGSAGSIMTGSHTDTVDGAGRFDGTVGVCGAIEAVRCLREAGHSLTHDLVVVDFFSEEPNRFGVSCVGSRALTGRLTPDLLDLRDHTGATFRQALESAGSCVDRFDDVALKPNEVRAFVELHIEQGRNLQDNLAQIGVVSTITGFARFRAVFRGQRDHAGSTPMTARHDAGCAAAGTVLAVERIGGERAHSRGTTGAIRLMPESVNVVSEIAEVVAEFRSPDDDWLAGAREALSNAADDEAKARGAGLELFWLPSEPPVRLASDVIAVCEVSATERGYAVLRMYSAAEHDTAFMARMFPSAMIFIPSKDGRSHCPDEWSDGSDIAAGVQTLVDSIVRLDATVVD
jgi:beta-ureidopropionase / N-carbamoyl-L-amino-acid hydrolase